MLKFTEDHEWLKIDGDVATVGITTHATEQLGDIVFVELPEDGKEAQKGDAVAVVESVKAASDVYMPLTGSTNRPRSTRTRWAPAGSSRSSWPMPGKPRALWTRRLT